MAGHGTFPWAVIERCKPVPMIIILMFVHIHYAFYAGLADCYIAIGIFVNSISRLGEASFIFFAS